jgi:hypothetical protein
MAQGMSRRANNFIRSNPGIFNRLSAFFGVKPYAKEIETTAPNFPDRMVKEILSRKTHLSDL